MAITQQTTHEMRTKLPEVKHVFLDRRYRQCVSLCEEFLQESNNDTHHIYRAYLNFYIALSHDALARSMHNFSFSRLPTFELAEKHYLAAAAELSAPTPTSFTMLETIREDVDVDHSEGEESLASSTTTSNRTCLKSKRSSVDSNSTAATSASEDEFSDCETPSKSKRPFRSSSARTILDDSTLPPPCSQSHASPISPSPTSRCTERYNIYMTAFANMLHAHIASVRTLKHPPTTNSTENPRSRDSNSTSRSRSWGIREGGEKMDQEKENEGTPRKKLTPRERFNPGKYEELCRKALAEI
ncbi:hypothetical protein K432DRAFT_344671 [Lepidopterella palustris CBS 459.81]|uniref:Uncharacterized protein n=1 Tax=Lepidopterella palustris CBS 459.81 TaxID=1314670 RepID=A0A8E2EIM2_9PEZI|nr:hypothetical protein K432DRAFT_344671 [Lepidopterella palustris CBS 459.81]